MGSILNAVACDALATLILSSYVTDSEPRSSIKGGLSRKLAIPGEGLGERAVAPKVARISKRWAEGGMVAVIRVLVWRTRSMGCRWLNLMRWMG